MPNLQSLVDSSKSSTFLTPRIGLVPGGVPSAGITEDTAENAARRQAMTENLFRTKYGEDPNESGILRAGRFLTASGIDIADMVTSATPFAERGDVWNKAREWGMDGMADFYQRNQSGVELTSGLVASVVTAGIADAYLVPALGARLASSTALSNTRLWKAGEAIIGNAKGVAVDAAKAAAIDGQLATVLGTSGGRVLLGARVAEGIARATVQEAAVAAVTHTNKEIWSDDASNNLMMMALGIGVGGALGALGARYEMRQIANSDEITNLRSAASDPYGYTLIREHQPTPKEMEEFGKSQGIKESTNYTALMLTARTNPPKDAPLNRARLIEAEAKQAEIQAQQTLQKITRKGNEGVPNSGFNLNDTKHKAAVNHLVEAGHEDPTIMLGIDSLGIQDFGRAVVVRNEYIKGLKESQNIDDIRLGRELESQEALGLVNGSWMPDSKELRELSEYRPGQIEMTPTTKTKGNYEFKLTLSNGNKVKVNEGGNVANFGSMSLVDQLKVYEGLNGVASRMITQGQEYILPTKPTWLQLDFARNFAAKGGKVDSMTYAKLATDDDMLLASLRQKADSIITNGNKPIGLWDRAKLNLPLPNSLERIHDGTGDTMVKVLNAVKKNQNITVKELKEIRRQLMEIQDLRTGIKQGDMALDGDMFNFNRSAKTGEWQPIVTGFASYKNISPNVIGTRDHLIISTAENKVYRTQRLQEGFHSKELVNTLLGMPEFQASINIRGLARDQITGAGGALDQGLGTFLTRNMRYRDSKEMQAAFRIREMIDRRTEEYTNNLISSTFKDSISKLHALPNRPSRELVNQWLSHAGGWDLKKGVEAVDGKFYGFALADTPANARRFEQEFGRKMADGDMLTNPITKKPIVVDDVALEFLDRFQSAANALLKDSNAVRSSRGLDMVGSKNWYVPPPSTKGKIVGFTLDANGKTVPGGAIVASSQAEFDALSKAKVAQLEADGKGYRFYSQSEIEAADDLWDLSDMGWVDPGFIGAKAGQQTGAIFSGRMNPNAMEDAMEWVTGKVKAISNGTVRSLYDQQLGIARARSAAENAVAGADRRTIYDEWEATILGRPLSSVKPGAGTAVVKSAEELTQSLINTGWPLAKAIGSVRLSNWTGDLTRRLGMGKIKSFKTFEGLAEQLGPYTPYKSSLDFAEANMRVSVPPEVREIANGMNRFAASMLLRWFEFPNAAMNMIGVVTNMPSILRSSQTPLLGVVHSANGKKVGIIDSYKILSGGFADMLSGAKHADWDTMVRNGDTTQSIAELNKQLSLVDSKEGWSKVFRGDKSIQIKTGQIPKSRAELTDWVKHKGIDGLASLATDTTESMSRSWAHFVGLRLADLNGITGTEARHSFARTVANQAIANYNPLNKPELFQTSFGSMFGLFTSYMQQYNQRLFRWMEVGDYRSVGRQLAMQSTLFGVASNPGYDGLEWLFQQAGIAPNGDQNATLTDAIYAKYGPKVGSIIANGGINELTKVFGLDEGLAIYTRGDANFRAPSLDPTKLMAGLGIVKSVADGMWEVGTKTFDAAMNDDSGVTWQYLSESIARNMPNRAMKGALQVMLNGGQEISASGEIVSQTNGWYESMLRMSGMRSGRQQGEIEAYYANANQRRRLAGRMETLREETRAMLRSGQPFDTMGLFNKYVERGGSPSHFKTWIQEQMKTVSDTRGMRQLVKSLNSPNTQLEAWRYEMRQ